MNIVHNIDYKLFLEANPDFKCDLVFSDVPYGINAGKMGFVTEQKVVKQKSGKILRTKPKGYGIEEWDTHVPGQDYFDSMVRISGHQIIFGIEYANWTGIGPGRIKWNKGVAEGMSFKSYEMAYCSAIDYEYQLDYLFSGMMQGKSHLEPMVMQGDKRKNEKRIHPTQKPVYMYLIALMAFAVPGMKIFDSHVGSGSLRIACDIFGCDFVGCEINEATFTRQEQRFLKHKHKLF